MCRHLTLIAILAAAAAAMSAAPASAKRSCGSTRLLVQPGVRAEVTIARGRLSCAQARDIARLYGSRRGVRHSFPSRTLGYSTYPGGWQCGTLDHGDTRCVRGRLGSLRHGFTRAATRNAREVVLLFLF